MMRYVQSCANCLRYKVAQTKFAGIATIVMRFNKSRSTWLDFCPVQENATSSY